MKKIITLALSVLMLASCFSFTYSVSAQNDGVMFSFNYQEKNNGVVDRKQTATVEKVEIDGVKALKVTPSPETALEKEVRLDCWSLDYSADQMKGVKYLTVKYRLDGKAPAEKPMRLQFLKGKGGLSGSKVFNSTENIKSDGWQIAVFDISAINDILVFEEGKKITQFHMYPYGQGVDVNGMTKDQVMYISDFTFYNKAPEIAGIKLPEVTGKEATSTTPPAPAVTEKTETKQEVDKNASKGDENGLLFSFNYGEKCNGVVDGKKTATTEKVEIDGTVARKIVPSPDTALSTDLRLDCYTLAYKYSDIANARFMTIKYKYEFPENAVKPGNMSVSILKNGGLVKSNLTAKALNETIADGQWRTVVFNISDLQLAADNPDAIFKQFHFNPMGSINPKNLTSDYVMYVSDISFWSLNPNPDTVYTVSFKKGHPEVQGPDPMSLALKRGEKFVLPEQNYEIANATFIGWKCSEDNQRYMPGTEMTVPDNDVTFMAEFDIEKMLDDYISLRFVEYQNGSCDKRDNIIVTNDIFEGKEVVKVVANPTGNDASKGAIVDGFNYAKAGIDLDVYKHLVITYYFDGKLPEKPVYFQANIMKNGGILTTTAGAKSAETLQSGKWLFATIDLSGVESKLTPNMTSHIMRQMHIYPYQGAGVADFTGEEALYINNLMFFKEKPDLKMHESYMKGYDGGLFKPQGNMTRAEACTIVARLSAGDDASVPADKTTTFADVTADQWYYKYVSYVESLGYLKSYSGNFEPNKAITRAEFVELVYNMGLLKDAGKNGVFTDVAADHPKAAVIAAAGKAGLVNGYDNGNGTFSFKPDATITRAEVVKVINNAYGRSITKDMLSAEVRYSFNDVTEDFWAYADIMEATLSHVENKNGWVFSMVNPRSLFGKTNETLDYAAGEAFVAELDKTAEAKKNAVLNTPNMDISKIKGTVYYVSNNGDDNADGKSPATAWKTAKKTTTAGLQPGDAVLFERGGLWRERFKASAGVTYSAYGEGKKPTFYGSPENGTGADNWTLMEGTTNIWVYKNELIDVGAIICDNGKVIGLKEVPDQLTEGVFTVRGTKGATPFDIKTELNENHEFFSEVRTTKSLTTTTGKLYFRCDEGNPGALFSQIEFNIKGNVISNGGNNCTFDNLCVMYTGTHGIGSGTTKNLTVTNCEIAWIGGTIQHYKSGTVVRLGNGVEIYGGCDGYLVDNNYIWQCYDAGATHQFSSGGNENISMYNICYSNNIIEDCIYNIEYFTGTPDVITAVRDGKNFVIRDNILRRSGYGWGNQRPDVNTSAHVKSWGHRNEYEKGTYIIENNIFDRSSWKLLQTAADYASWCPVYKNNTYVQYIDGGLCEHATVNAKYDCYAEETIKYDMGDAEAKVYFLPESYKHQGFLKR